MRLALLRHSRPLVPDGLVYGRSEVPVDPTLDGAVADAVLDQLADVRSIVSSPRSRCLGLAHLLAARLRLDVEVDPRLREVDLGSWEGRTWSSVPREELDAWSADFADFRPGGGESARQVLVRVSEALVQWRRGATDQVWVTHAGVIRAVDLVRAGITEPAASQWPRRLVPYGECEWLDAPEPLRDRHST